MKCGTTVSVYTAFISRMQHKPALALYSGCRRCLSCPVTDLQGTLSDMLDVVVFWKLYPIEDDIMPFFCRAL